MRLTCSLALAAVGLLLAARWPVGADEPKQKCLVCTKEFAFSAETPFVLVNGAKVGFHCPKCPPRFAADPEKYLTGAGNCPVGGHAAKVSRETRIVVNNALYYTCCADCRPQFAKDPAKWVKELKDPVTGKTFAPKSDSPRAEVSGQVYLFADAASKASFDRDNARYVTLFK